MLNEETILSNNPTKTLSVSEMLSDFFCLVELLLLVVLCVGEERHTLPDTLPRVGM